MKEKNVFTSKKFAAFFVSLAVIAGIIITALVFRVEMNVPTSACLSIGLLAMGCLTIGYILGQAALDKFIRGLKGGSDESQKSVE